MSGPKFHCDDPACDRCYADALDYEIFASLDAPTRPRLRDRIAELFWHAWITRYWRRVR